MTADSSSVVESVTRSLPQDARTGPDLVVLRRLVRRRSTLYFVGLSARRPRICCVVKRPNTDVQQHDLEPPATAADQYEALRTLRDQLQRLGAPLSAPAPLALLPEIGAFAMEYVQGRSIAQVLRPDVVVRPQQLFAALVDAAATLRAVHAFEPAQQVRVAAAGADVSAPTDVRILLDRAGLPVRPGWFGERSRAPGQVETWVRLHGDYAPENILLTSHGSYCLDPDLSTRGLAEHDVVRFLTMLFDAPFFVTGVGLPPVQRLRRQAAAVFVEHYYAGSGPPPAFQPMLVDSLARRWVTRHEHVVARAPSLQRARTSLLHRYFCRLLDEQSATAAGR